jgi:UDP-N-acetylglucosamine--N-acetylmuramyl-(pentapeptide) pyrophosphoryl-undecaprenol N-acetylglucosamine transferase
MEEGIVPAEGLAMAPISMRGVQEELWRNLPLVYALPASMVQALRILGRFKPHAVLGTGGYITAPVGVAALLHGVPLVLQEQNAVPGRTTRVLARRAALVCTAYVETAAHLQGTRTEHTGTPLRAGFAAAGRAVREGGPDGSRGMRRLVVVGGSQGAHRINTAVAEGLKSILALPGLSVHHVCGSHDIDDLRAMRGGLAEATRARYTVEPFHEAMVDLLAGADLVVSRAGGSAIAETTGLGIPMVLVPYPHAGGHQRFNAAPVVEAGAAVSVPDEELSGVRLVSEITRLHGDPGALLAMRRASLEYGKPDAAREVARLVLASGL